MDFFSACQTSAAQFLQQDKRLLVRIIAHHDSDGIAGAAIISKALLRLGRRFSVRLVPQLTPDILKELQKEPYQVYFFIDLGSTMLEQLTSIGSTIIVLDHHRTNGKPPEQVTVICPWEYGYDGAEEIASAGLAFFFAQALDKKNEDLAHLALIGAIGDLQEKKGFKGLNKEILRIAKEKKLIEEKEDFLFYGGYSKPLYKVLEYTTIPFFPGVSGSEQGAMKLLKSCGISLRKGKEFTKLYHLTKEEKILLLEKLLERNPNLKEEDLIGTVYLLTQERKGSPLKDAREFSTMLNACGRLQQASLALGACLNDRQMKKQALEILQIYKRQIIDAFLWFEEQQDSEDIIIKESHIIFNAKQNIPASLVGVIATILAHSPLVNPKTYIVGMARENQWTKVSFRISHEAEDVDILSILSQLPFVSYGGHKRAAGGIIHQEDEEAFIQQLDQLLEEKAKEEVIE